MSSWEYKQVTIEDADLVAGKAEARLNELGLDDWELVTAVQREKHGYSRDVYFFFKRVKP